jgi:hypothetical protein
MQWVKSMISTFLSPALLFDLPGVTEEKIDAHHKEGRRIGGGKPPTSPTSPTAVHAAARSPTERERAAQSYQNLMLLLWKEKAVASDSPPLSAIDTAVFTAQLFCDQLFRKPPATASISVAVSSVIASSSCMGISFL